MYKGSNQDLVGQPFLEFVHPTEKENTKRYYQKSLAGERVGKIHETTLVDKHGSPVYVELNAGIILFENQPADLVIIRDAILTHITKLTGKRCQSQ